jgi:hypothetical protein
MRSANRIDHTIDTTGIALLHKGHYILLACIDNIARTPALCHLQARLRYITDNDLFDTVGACSGDSAKSDRPSAENEQTLLWLNAAERDGVDGTRQWLGQ